MSSGPYFSAAELADRIRNRECTATEVLDAHLARIEQRNPTVNAVVTLNRRNARARAEAADDALKNGEVWGPLHGVPITVKDQYATRGLRTTHGLPQYRSFIPDITAPVLEPLYEAGAILLGKTNLPFASYDWQSRNPQFGRANNPWALSRTPGGSSGGSAAALAAGMAPLEMGADVAGSIRVPCHCCGVTGLRPTERTLPLHGLTPPDRPRTVHHIMVPGPMARTVEDLQLAWGVLTDQEASPSPPLDSLRIAVTPELGEVPIDTDTQRVVRRAVATLRAEECTVEYQPAPFDVETALETWGRIQGFELNAGMPAVLRSPPLKALVWHGAFQVAFGTLGRRLSRGAHLSTRGYFYALARKDQLAGAVDDFLTEWDLWLTPAASIPAFPHCWTGQSLSIEGVSVPYALPFAAYNCATALTGHPILLLPAGCSEGGLPIGMQVHARRGADSRLLATGRRLETVFDAPSVPAMDDEGASP